MDVYKDHDDVACGETETTGLGMDLERFIQAGGVVGVELEPRCKRHRKEPSCVVGEQRHCPFGNDDAAPLPLPFSLVGDVETVSLLLP